MRRHACNTDLITLLMLPKTKSCRVPGPVYQSFITNYDGFAYYKLRDEVLLQIITNYGKFLTNWQVQLYYSRRQHYNKLGQLLQIISEQTCCIFPIIFWKRIFPKFMVARKVTATGCLLDILTQPLYIFEFFVLCVIVRPSELFLSFDLAQNRMQNSWTNLTHYF